MNKLIDEGLLESLFVSAIKRVYGDVSIQLVKDRLFEKYGTSLHLAVNNDFEKIQEIIVENFGDGINSIKAEMLNDMLSLQQGLKSVEGIIVEDQDKIKNIMHILNDDECSIILQEISTSPKTIGEMIDVTGLSKTSIYRKISLMKKEELVRQEGFKITHQNKIPKYSVCFEDIKIIVSKNKTVAHIF